MLKDVIEPASCGYSFSYKDTGVIYFYWSCDFLNPMRKVAEALIFSDDSNTSPFQLASPWRFSCRCA
jgi:hypothetical protein